MCNRKYENKYHEKYPKTIIVFDDNGVPDERHVIWPKPNKITNGKPITINDELKRGDILIRVGGAKIKIIGIEGDVFITSYSNNWEKVYPKTQTKADLIKNGWHITPKSVECNKKQQL